MIREIFTTLRATDKLLLTALVLVTLNTQAFAAISKPESSNAQGAQAAVSTQTETSAILSQASLIAFEGAKTLETLQKSMSGDQQASATLQQSELAQNFVKSIHYDPKKTALPSDADAMDEPWQVSSTAGLMNEDGLVIPHLSNPNDDEDGHAGVKGVEIDSASVNNVSKFLRLLKPLPAAMITSPFGFRWGRPHQGIDMGAPMGTPIEAAEAGKVIYSGWKQGYGNFIAIEHGHGLETHYAHCSKLLVGVGEKVRKGEIIGKVGNTGNSTGPHLHFEVVANGVHRNPIKYINHTMTLVQATR
jgi:murein DD-endopeptidase MepM/ murein hydrolase activator NlpD